MSRDRTQTERTPVYEASLQLREATAAAKCWPCGCLHSSLQAAERALPEAERTPELAAALGAARERLQPISYDCLGCAICYPALAINALQKAGGDSLGDVCPTDAVEPRAGWPPLPGNYTVLRYRAPVAVCTLTDNGLAHAIAEAAPPEVSIVGTLQTENLGIERLIHNVVANPWIRFLVLAGEDSRQAIGHLPGQSLVSLVQNGLDDRGRIIGAHGKRPVLRHLAPEAVEHFRHTITVVDRIGETVPSVIFETTARCAAGDPGPAIPNGLEQTVQPKRGYLPARLVPDPAGYFVVYADRAREILTLEHYRQDGVLDAMVEGRTAAELYTPAIEQGLCSRLDHAAYLGRELARAERALATGELYVQDAAPERIPTTECGCGPECEGRERS